MTDKIIVYCDGACSGNQYAENVGGWGAVLTFGNNRKEIFGGEKNTTNNRMELMACIKALTEIKTNDIPIEIYADSAYLVNCMQQGWYKGWLKNGWKTSQKKPVENKDLWVQLLDILKGKENVTFIKVKGHVGIELNEVADQLANKGMDEVRNPVNSINQPDDDKKYLVNSNEKIFDTYNILSTRLQRLSGIIQNRGIHISEEQYQEWNKLVSNFEREFKMLIDKTKSCLEPV